MVHWGAKQEYLVNILYNNLLIINKLIILLDSDPSDPLAMMRPDPQARLSTFEVGAGSYQGFTNR